MSDATDHLVAAMKSFGDETLRDVWVFDQWTHEQLYARDDGDDRFDTLDVEGFIDNERYGYITRSTYESLCSADYDYTVRGFSSFELFRTFVSDDHTHIGIIARFDRCDGGYDFGAFLEEIQAVFDEYSVSEFTPSDDAH